MTTDPTDEQRRWFHEEEQRRRRDLAAHDAALDRTLTEFERIAQAKLYWQGKPRYTPEEHQRQREALVAFHVDPAVYRAQQSAETVQAEADAQLASLHADPTRILTTEQLARANAAESYIREDCTRLPLAQLATRLETVITSGDKASMWLHHRFAQARLDEREADYTADPRRVRSDAESAGILAAMDAVKKLETALYDADGIRARAATRKRAAEDLSAKATSVRHQADGTTERQAKEFARLPRYQS
jgi:hypothetical protein